MKPVFKSPSYWKKQSNTIGYSLRILMVLSFGIMCMSWPMLSQGLKNHAIEEKRNKWIREEVRDIKNTDFARLDIEDEPVPLIPQQIK